MIDFLKLFGHVVVSPFKTRARLEVEIVLLRHQLNVLRRRVASKPKFAVADRLLVVWLYRLFPSMWNAVATVQPETIKREVHAVGRTSFVGTGDGIPVRSGASLASVCVRQ